MSTSEVHSLLAKAHIASTHGQVEKALSLSKQAAEQFPNSADARSLRGELLLRSGYLQAARQNMEQACELAPEDEQKVLELYRVLELLEAWPDLLKLTESSIRLWPENPDWLMRRAETKTYLGDFDTASNDYLQVLERCPGHPDAMFPLVMRGNGSAVGGLDGIETRLVAQDLKPEERNRLCYARAYLLEQAGRYVDAFEAYRDANADHAAMGGMNLEAKQNGARMVLQDITPHVIKKYSGQGNKSNRPVFIIGMPRSGTTLVEQVLAAHPDVFAAGEHLIWNDVLRGLVSAAPRKGASVIEAINCISPDIWKQAGDEYLQRVSEIDADSQRITDKLPANFGLLPYVRLIFPRARIIHVCREPLATLASCIRTPFANPLLSFNVEDWARFHGVYQALMDHWQPVLGHSMIEIRYESLVHDLPAEAHRLVEFLGLHWNDACLHPELAKRAVKTASVQQVRQGVYTDSVSAWRHYENQLEPLRALIVESRDFVAAAAPGGIANNSG
jgi:tetratricopeptide (TPR) repeat protein